MLHRIGKIVSGGQTGADRAALDHASSNGLDYGGYVPAGRIAEDGEIPDRYSGLVESVSPDPAERTRLNVVHSDATLLITHGYPSGGSKLTLKAATDLDKPVLHVDLSKMSIGEAAAFVRIWLDAVRPATLNVAGPRSSEDTAIYASVIALLTAIST